MKFIPIVTLLSALTLLTACKRDTDSMPENARYIDPMIGAVTYGEETEDIHGYGKTFPGAAIPFGLVQLSPDTITGGDNGCGYSWNHNTIEGFSFLHLSGVGWYGEFGNLLVMPTTGPLHTEKGTPDDPENGYRSRFSHEQESASSGYYQVELLDYDIQAEATVAQRSGILRFTFPENEVSRIQIDLARRIGGSATEQFVRVEDEQTLSGWMRCTPETGGWGNGEGNANYTVYFWCQLSKPIVDYGFWNVDFPDGWIRKRDEINFPAHRERVANAGIVRGQHELGGDHIGFFTEFPTVEDEQVILKCGISFVSVEGARKNLEMDIPGWDFEKVKAQARNRWNEALISVQVTGDSEEDKIKFYTALYHTMIDPRSYADSNGEFIGADNKVHQSDNFTYRTVFSGWDVFRSQFPLQTIINPRMVNDEINTLLHMAEASDRGYLPRWEIVNSYSGCMLGNPAVSVIVDAYTKGIREYDVGKAFSACVNSVEEFGNGELGYVEDMISETLEYAYSEWCVGIFAEALNKPELAQKYFDRGQSYRNIWNTEVDWFRGRNAAGDWREWEGLTVHDDWESQGCIESNPLQQAWFVPHDLDGLIALMGSRERFINTLVDFFENTPDDFTWNDYYNHANEPVHHVPFLFNEVDRPDLTQKWTRKICSNAYGTDAFGLCGNEDVGQMSAWYVLAAMGIYPICPGDTRYQVTSPVFNSITIQLDEHFYRGNTFTIIADNNSPENIYIQSIMLNGKPLDRYWIRHDEITSGGILELVMGPEPLGH